MPQEYYPLHQIFVDPARGRGGGGGNINVPTLGAAAFSYGPLLAEGGFCSGNIIPSILLLEAGGRPDTRGW